MPGRKTKKSVEMNASPEKGRHITSIRAMSALVFVGSISVFLITMSPGISWEHHSEDSGDLITAAYVLGIPHPTGYPLYCILGYLWTHIFQLGSVAWRMNLMSGLTTAFAAVFTFRAVYRSYDLLPDETRRKLGRGIRSLAAISSGFLLAFATDVWKHSVITEVYSLNLFFAAAISWTLVEILAGARAAEIEGGKFSESWEKRRWKLIALAGMLGGFALCNHMTSILFLPIMLIILLAGRVGMKVREFALGTLSIFLPLILYFYLPIRSRADPVLDWGNPEDWDSFVWVVTGAQFSKLMFSMLPFQMLHQIMTYNSLGTQLGLFGAIAVGLGVSSLFIARSGRAGIFLLLTIMLTFTGLFYITSYYIWDPEGYLLPMVLGSVLWASWCPVIFTYFPDKIQWLVKPLAVLLLLLMPFGALVEHYEVVDLSGNRTAIQYGEESFAAFEENALVLEIRYERAFTLWYYREVEYVDTRDDVAVVFVEHTLYPWGLEILERKYPDLVLMDEPIELTNSDAASAEWLVEQNIDLRPIYIGAIVDNLVDKGYQFEAVGLMYRVLPPG